MVNYLEVLSGWMEQPHYVLVILITTYLIAASVDFVIGSFNAAYTEGVTFSTRKAQLGIVRKLVTMAVMILVVPLALLLPMDTGTYLLTILYLGIVATEIYSILAHIGIVKDGDKHKNLIGILFTSLLETVFKSKNMNSDDTKIKEETK